MGAHAKKSASGAKRWLACPGSIELTDRLPKAFRNRSSEAARLGTAAHGLGEYGLVNRLRTVRGMQGGFACLDENEDAHVFEPGAHGREELEAVFVHVYPIDDDMISAVDVYLDTCWNIYDSLDPLTVDMMVEKRFNLEWLRPDMFGTGDCSIKGQQDPPDGIIVKGGRMYVIDYKHGQGVPVEVVDRDETGWEYPNKQLMYYALGLAHDVEWDFDDLELVVVQPRCPHPDGPVRSLVVTKQQLMAFQDELAHGSDMVEIARNDPYKYLKAGSHCQFCPVGPTCPELVKNAQEVAAMDFDDDPFDLDPPVLDGTPEALEKLGKILAWKPKIDALLRAADALAQRMLEQGQTVPGMKLVRKKSNRKFAVDAHLVEEALIQAKVISEGEESKLYSEPKLKSPAQIEKMGKAAKLLVNGVPNPDYDPELEGSKKWLVEPLAYKPEGGITMAPESDPREAVRVDAASDFDDDLDYDPGEE